MDFPRRQNAFPGNHSGRPQKTLGLTNTPQTADQPKYPKSDRPLHRTGIANPWSGSLGGGGSADSGAKTVPRPFGNASKPAGTDSLSFRHKNGFLRKIGRQVVAGSSPWRAFCQTLDGHLAICGLVWKETCSRCLEQRATGLALARLDCQFSQQQPWLRPNGGRDAGGG